MFQLTDPSKTLFLWCFFEQDLVMGDIVSKRIYVRKWRGPIFEKDAACNKLSYNKRWICVCDIKNMQTSFRGGLPSWFWMQFTSVFSLWCDMVVLCSTKIQTSLHYQIPHEVD